MYTALKRTNCSLYLPDWNEFGKKSTPTSLQWSEGQWPKTQYGQTQLRTVAAVSEISDQITPSSFALTNPSDNFGANFNQYVITPLTNSDSLPKLVKTGPSPTDRLQAPPHNFGQAGSYIKSSNQYHVWAGPYYTQGRTESFANQSALRDRQESVTIGAEKRSLVKQWTIGMMTGIGRGSTVEPQNNNTHISSKSSFVGIYHSKGFLNHARYDVGLTAIFNENHSQRSTNLNSNTTPVLALANYGSRTLLTNFETSYRFKLSQQTSLRPNLGFAYNENKHYAYQESNAGANNLSYPQIRNHSKEVYVGIGLRHAWKVNQFKYKLTGIWEHGYEMTNTSNTQTVYKMSSPESSFSVTNQGPARHTNYFTACGSVLNTNNNIKVLTAYKASLQSRRIAHTFTLKVEYRF
jgi:uncharacterized protein YhjY with autotransporter beta-barrel domain